MQLILPVFPVSLPAGVSEAWRPPLAIPAHALFPDSVRALSPKRNSAQRPYPRNALTRARILTRVHAYIIIMCPLRARARLLRKNMFYNTFVNQPLTENFQNPYKKTSGYICAVTIKPLLLHPLSGTRAAMT